MYRVIFGDVRRVLKNIKAKSIQCIVTSPPYWNQRNYENGIVKWEDWEGCLGLEPDIEMYISHLAGIFDQCFRVLRKDGVLFLNLGDTYIGSGKGAGTKSKNKQSYKLDKKLINEDLSGWKKSKQLALIPSRIAIEMQNRGWILRNDIIWHKPNAMPSSVKDRFTVDYEHIFFFVKDRKYKFNQILEPYLTSMNRWGGEELKADKKSDWDSGTGQKTYRKRNMRPNKEGRNKRSVWSINTKSYKESHFAVFNEDLIKPMILAGSDKDDFVLDPFIGSGTTLIVCKDLKRNCIGIEINKSNKILIKKRLRIYEEKK